jgi:4-carboxymuconolactone decarboxylase
MIGTGRPRLRPVVQGDAEEHLDVRSKEIETMTTQTDAQNFVKVASERSDFGTFGRYIETPVDQMSPEMRSAYDFTKNLRGVVPGPHKMWLANPKLSKTIVPTGAYYQTQSTLTKAEIEITTNVINGRWLAAYGNYEHEMIAEKLGGLPPEKVEALIAGLPTSFDDPRQQVVYELASTLAQPRVVPKGLYRRAKELLGDEGIVDVTMLMGWFTGVSLTLMAFDVPSNATGLEQ